MANVNMLFRFARRGFVDVVLMSSKSMAILLTGGVVHVVAHEPKYQGRTCGLLPLGAVCDSVQTEGLKWNLTGQSMKFGGMVSSSNCIADGVSKVRVCASHDLLWTVKLLDDVNEQCA